MLIKPTIKLTCNCQNCLQRVSLPKETNAIFVRSFEKTQSVCRDDSSKKRELISIIFPEYSHVNVICAKSSQRVLDLLADKFWSSTYTDVAGHKFLEAPAKLCCNLVQLSPAFKCLACMIKEQLAESEGGAN